MANAYNGGMPPGNQPPPKPIDTDHMLPRHAGASGEGGPPAHKKPVGPIVGVIIIVLLMAFGALYFWGATLNQKNPDNNLPLIPADSSTPTGQ